MPGINRNRQSVFFKKLYKVFCAAKIQPFFKICNEFPQKNQIKKQRIAVQPATGLAGRQYHFTTPRYSSFARGYSILSPTETGADTVILASFEHHCVFIYMLAFISGSL